MDGEAQPAAAHVSAMDISLDHDPRIVRPEFRGKRGWLIAPADLPYVLWMLVLVAERPLASGDEG